VSLFRSRTLGEPLVQRPQSAFGLGLPLGQREQRPGVVPRKGQLVEVSPAGAIGLGV
jgi:hypothetical protein